MEEINVQSAVEAILFASGDPMPAERIALILGVEVEAVYQAATELADFYSFERRGIRLVRMENRLQLCSSPEYAQEVAHAMEMRKPPKLSQSALEALSVVAYFQPVTRAYIDQVRGVDSSYSVGVLLERGLIEACGKLDAPGRPTLFQTTDTFLRTMGMQSLDELPPLPDVETEAGLKQLQSAIEEKKAEAAASEETGESRPE